MVTLDYAYWQAPRITLPHARLIKTAHRVENKPLRKLWGRLGRLRHKALPQSLPLGETIAPLLYLLEENPVAWNSLIDFWAGGDGFHHSDSFGADSFTLHTPDGTTLLSSSAPDLLTVLRCMRFDDRVERLEVKAGMMLGMTEEQALAASSARSVTWLETPMLCIAVAHLDASAEALRRASAVFDILTSHKVNGSWTSNFSYSVNENQPGLTAESRGDFYQRFEPKLIAEITERFVEADCDTENVLAWQVIGQIMPDLTIDNIIQLERNGTDIVSAYRLWAAGFTSESIVRMKENDIDADLSTNIFPSRTGEAYNFNLPDSLYVELASKLELERAETEDFNRTFDATFYL